MEQNSGDSGTGGWASLPDHLRSHIPFLCPEGKFMVCATCREFDSHYTSREKYGKVMSYDGNGRWGRFSEHVKQNRHVEMFIRKQHLSI